MVGSDSDRNSRDYAEIMSGADPEAQQADELDDDAGGDADRGDLALQSLMLVWTYIYICRERERERESKEGEQVVHPCG